MPAYENKIQALLYVRSWQQICQCDQDSRYLLTDSYCQRTESCHQVLTVVLPVQIFNFLALHFIRTSRKPYANSAATEYLPVQQKIVCHGHITSSYWTRIAQENGKPTIAGIHAPSWSHVLNMVSVAPHASFW